VALCATSRLGREPGCAGLGLAVGIGCLAVRLLGPLCMRRGAELEVDQGPRLSERSEFERDPTFSEHRRLPAAQRRDADSGAAFSLVPFFWPRKRKVLRRRAQIPAGDDGDVQSVKPKANPLIF
jgi:hypothetical protein